MKKHYGQKKLEISHVRQILTNEHLILVLSQLSNYYCKNYKMAAMVAWQLCQERKHGRYPELPAQQHYKNGSSASMEALPAWKHCQHDSYARNASIASTATLPARQQCQHGSIASKTASKIAIPEWQLWQYGQHGSMASTAELPEWQLCYYRKFSFLHAIE